MAEQILHESVGGDGFSVLLLAAPPRRVVPEPADDWRKVAAEIHELRLPHGNGDLAATLHAVDDMLRRSPSKYEHREVYFLTDLQRATWAAPLTPDLLPVLRRIEARARTIVVDVGHEVAGNSAVTCLALGVPVATSGAETPFTALVHHYGVEPRLQAPVELCIGAARARSGDLRFELRTRQQMLVDLKPGANSISFTHQFRAPGDYVVQLRLANDALDLDDVRTAVVMTS